MTVAEGRTVYGFKVTEAQRFLCYYFIGRRATDRDKWLCQR